MPIEKDHYFGPRIWIVQFNNRYVPVREKPEGTYTSTNGRVSYRAHDILAMGKSFDSRVTAFDAIPPEWDGGRLLRTVKPFHSYRAYRVAMKGGATKPTAPTVRETVVIHCDGTCASARQATRAVELCEKIAAERDTERERAEAAEETAKIYGKLAAELQVERDEARQRAHDLANQLQVYVLRGEAPPARPGSGYLERVREITRAKWPPYAPNATPLIPPAPVHARYADGTLRMA